MSKEILEFRRANRYPGLFALAVFLLLSPLALADLVSGEVVKVVDGDTAYVLDVNRIEHKIRLAGIDAPERGQPFGQRSKQLLADMIATRLVSVEWSKRDRYGRIVGKILSENQDVNLEMIRYGMAWWYRKYAHEQSPEDQRLYEQAEIEARHGERGLWSDPESMAPWDWRDYRRTHRAPSPNRDR